MEIELLVEGGNASPGPPLGPELGPTDIDVGEVVEAINKETKDFEGTEVPVTVKIEDEEFEIEVGTPPTAELIKDELGIETGSGEPNKDFVADLSMEQIKSVAQMKSRDLLAKDLKASVKEVIGTCVSLGVTIEGEDPRKAIDLVEREELEV